MFDTPKKTINFAQTVNQVSQVAQNAKRFLLSALVLMIVGMTIFFFGYFTKYENRTDGWSLYYPRGWEVKEELDAGGIVVFLAKKQSPLDFFQDNISITYTKMRTPITIEEYPELTKKQMTETLSDVRASDASMVNISGHRAAKMIFQAAGDIKLTFVVYAFLVDDVAYNITYAGMTEHYEKSGRYIFDIVMATLRVMF